MLEVSVLRAPIDYLRTALFVGQIFYGWGEFASRSTNLRSEWKDSVTGSRLLTRPSTPSRSPSLAANHSRPATNKKFPPARRFAPN